MDIIEQNLIKVKQNIEDACKKSGRHPEEVKLVAVTKTLPPEIIAKAYNYGIKIVGENKAQELVDKYQLFSHLPLSWHFIGHLQTNKVKYLVDKVAMIHSVDRIKLAKEINKEWEKSNNTLDILIQVNISGERSKFGINVQETIKLVLEIANFKSVCIKGLMTMAPYTENPEEVRCVFAGLRELGEKIKKQKISGVEMQELSMGMTNDYKVAIEEGATLIRIGSGIFGERQ